MNHEMSITETECQPSLSGSNRLGKQSLFIYTLLYIPASSSSSSVISNSKCRLWSQWSWICRLFSRSSLLSCFCWGTEESQENWGSQRKGKHKSLKLVRMNFFLQLSQPLYYGSSAGFWEDGYAVGYIPCTLTQFWMKNVIPYV